MTIDITDKDYKEQALQESENKLSLIYNSVSDLLILIKVEPNDVFRVISVNKAFSKITGLHTEEILYKTGHEVLSPEAAQIRDSKLKKVVEQKTSVTYEWPDIFNKNLHNIETVYNPIFDEDGKVTHIVGTSRDITEHKKGEKALKESEQKLSLIYNTVSDLLTLIKVEPNDVFRFASVNQAFVKMTGQPVDVIINKTLDDFLPYESAQFRTSKMKKVIAQKESITFERTENFNNRDFILETTLNPILDKDGKVTHILGVNHDITERKNAEDAQIKREKRFESIATSTDDILWEFNAETGVLDFFGESDNTRLNTLVNVPSSFDDFMKIIHPDDFDKVSNIFASSQITGKNYCIEFRIMDSNGGYRHQESHGKAFEFKGGKPVKWAGATKDISERKEYELRLNAINEELNMERSILQNKNVALKEILNQIESEKKDTALQIKTNIDKLISPLINLLKERSGDENLNYLQMLEENLNEIVSPFVKSLEDKFSNLTPREIEICILIKKGMSIKEIASSLKTSEGTVKNQRKNIRKKLGISSQTTNLYSFLKSLEE